MKILLLQLQTTDNGIPRHPRGTRTTGLSRLLTAFCLLLTIFCSTSFASYTVSNTSASASVTGSFAFTIQEINNASGNATINFDIPGPGPHTVPMGGLTCYYGLAMSPLGLDTINLSGNFYVYDVSSLNLLTVPGNITFREGSDLNNVNVTGSVRLEDDGTSHTIQDCNFIGGQLNLSTNYTVGNKCAFSNATVNLQKNCDVQATNWSGNNTLSLYSNNKITRVANGNLTVAGDYNNITYSAFKTVSLTGDNNTFKNNTVSFDSSIANFTGDDNLISSNSFSSALSETPTITGTHNDFFHNHSFSNDTGVKVIGNYNKIQGNIIGLNINGNKRAGNQNDGVEINGWNNTVGGGFFDEENYISGNGGDGIKITAGAWNKIYNNYIGIGINSTNNVGNNGDGINIGSSYNNIVDKENYISGNGGDGIQIFGGGTNQIYFNYIGLPLNGANKTGNADNGIFISSSSRNIIGNSAFGGSYICDNGKNGIKINNGLNNSICNNYIGFDVSGTNKHGNSEDGIYIDSGTSNTIGSAIEGENYICYNGGEGVYALNSSALNIQNNFIGINISNNAAGNFAAGVLLHSCNPSTIINNSIAANKGNGISIIGGGGTEKTLIGANLIGILGTGTVLGNTNAGVYLENGRFVTIGTNGFRNIISGNDGPGIEISGGGNNIIQNNIIGMDNAGTARKPNAAGIVITNSSDNLIGGISTNYRNYISGNDGNGIEFRAKCTNNFVQYNYIGVGLDGTNNIFNSGHGIFMLGASGRRAEYNVIGGYYENVIGFNKKDGIYIGDNATRNNVDGNYIGVHNELMADIGNGLNGISIYDHWNKIGTEVENYISANGSNGIFISDCGWSEIRNNYIGFCSTGLVNQAFPNIGDGIRLVNDADFNYIGLTNTDSHYNYNFITANKGNGIYIGEDCDGSRIMNNYIGMTMYDDLTIPVNGNAGIYLYKCSDNWIGGLDSGKENNIVGKNCLAFEETGGNWTYRNYIGYPSKTTNVLIGIYIKSSDGGYFGQTPDHKNFIGNAGIAAALAENSTNIAFRSTYVGINHYYNPATNIGDGIVFSNCYDCNVEGGYIAGSKIGVNIIDSEKIYAYGNYIGYDSPVYYDNGNREFAVKASGGRDIRVGRIGSGNYISGNDGHGVEISGTANSFVYDNRIGLWTNGTNKCENKGDGLRILDSTNIVVGDVDRNYIAACAGNGVFISGGQSNEFSNNRIGVATDANTAVANAGTGLIIENSSGNEISQNIIGGNGGDGICVSGSLAFANSFLANYIGIAFNGSTIITNKKCGVKIIGAPGNFIGKPTWGNLICGSGDDGIKIEGVNSSNNIASHNYIGLNFSLQPKGNSGNGIQIIDAANCAISNNIICASGKSGVKIADSTVANLARYNRIENNDIGYYNNYNQANAFDGVQIYKATFNYIGLSNVISGNGRNGVNITGFGAQDNFVNGNFIGVTKFGFPAPNGGHGVQLNGGDANKVGFTNDWEKNYIANNVSNGVNVAFGIYNRILGNSIFDNGMMGINLGAQGRTSGDTPGVPNNYQPYPVLDGAYSGSVTRIVGYLSAKPDANYLLEFFATPNTNEAGYGEGKTFVGRNFVDTAGDGVANFAIDLDSAVENGYIITATATATNGNSSEFSVPVWVSSASLSADFAVDQTLVLTGAVVNFTDMSAGIPTAWAWDFDNNGSTDSTSENPQHSYSSVGDKSVKLTVTDSGSSTIVKTNIIRVGGARHSVTNESTNLQNVIDSSQPYDIIELAGGTYSQSGKTVSQSGRNFYGPNVFVLDNNITLIGSDDTENPSVIDGLGSMRCAYVISGKVVSVTFINGSATGAGANGQGGGAVCGEEGEIDRCITMNSSATEGGGIFVNYGGVIKSCLIISNSATSGGGVVVANGGAAFNTTIADNEAATSAGGALCAGEMVNNIVYYNSSPTDPNVTISVGTFTYGCTTPAKTGAGNISGDPELLPNYGIEFSSPCAGTGVEFDWMSWSKDLSGEPRLRGNESDMGAYSAIPEGGIILLIVTASLWLLRNRH